MDHGMLLSGFLLLVVEGGIVAAEQAPESAATGRAGGLPIELLGPHYGTTVALRPTHRPAIVFSWRSVPGRPTYRLLIAGTRDFKRPIVDRTTKGTAESVQGVTVESRYFRLESGRYYWKVTAGDASSSVGSFRYR